MKVLVTGGAGQLATELARTAPPHHELVSLDRQELDLTDAEAIATAIDEHRPEAVVNTAAYTAVDQAEEEPEAAFATNAEGAGRLAEEAGARGASVIQVSTDFVFGDGGGAPRRPEDPTEPLNVYGSSKLEGERRVAAATAGEALIVRTAWLYSSHGDNFVTSVLRRLRVGEPLAVVADQVGTPTWARGLARALWRGLDRGLSGIHHWTDAGVASWYDFAVAVQDEAISLGLLGEAAPIQPQTSADYPTAARRPASSVLEKSATWKALDLEPTHWRRALRVMLGEVETSI